MKKLNGLLLIIILQFIWPCYGRPEFKVPALTGPVMDNGNMFSQRAIQQTSKLIRAIHNSGGSQLQVLSIRGLGGLPIESVSIQITDQWKIGDKTKDNGILLLFAKNDKKVRIEVGQGLEGDLPDAYAKRIIDNIIVPHFKFGNFDDGLVAGVYEIFRHSDKDLFRKIVPENESGIHSYSEGQWPKFFRFIFLIFLVLLLIFIRFCWSGGGGWSGGDGGWSGSGGGWSGGGGGWSGGGGGWSGGGGGWSGGGASGNW